MKAGLSSNEFLKMRKFIEDRCGIAISEDKAYLIESRLSKLLIDFRLSSFEDLYARIASMKDPDIVEKVIDLITTNETSWFRDMTPWVILEEALLPGYINDLREKKRMRIYIWSAACSTGQEPYSIAMCIDNYLDRNGITDITLADFEILATDISRTVLDIARTGRYDNISITRGLGGEYREKYFKSDGRGWILSDKIKRAVTFKQLNLQKDITVRDAFDIVFCRYVIIYFSERLKKEVLDKIGLALKKNGVLFVGSSELIDNHSGSYLVEHYKNGVYYRLKE